MDVATIVRRSVELLVPRARDKNLDVQCYIEPDLPKGIKGDPVRLRQILLNLVGNAIKFTDAGSITVDVQTLQRDEVTVTVAFEVRDTGIGIPADKISSLFSPFTQVDASMTRRFGGTGLGLSISRRLVDLMGGEISVSSHEGDGSIFKFYIPFLLTDQATENISVTAKVDPPVAQQVGAILLVEDNPVNQMLAVAMLSKGGHQVDVAENGEQALQALSSHRYDMVLMDCQMPVMDGYEATRRLRAGDPPVLDPNIPVIAMTASVLIEDQKRCFAVGMNGFISKPFQASELQQKIAQVLAQRQPPSHN